MIPTIAAPITVVVASVAAPAGATSHVVITAAGDIATRGAGGSKTVQLIQSIDPARVLTPWAVAGGEPEQREEQVEVRTFLRDTLRSDSHLCELVYFHHPRWSSGEHGNDPGMDGIWTLRSAWGRGRAQRPRSRVRALRQAQR